MLQNVPVVGEESNAGLRDVKGCGFDDGLVHSLDVRLEALSDVL